MLTREDAVMRALAALVEQTEPPTPAGRGAREDTRELVAAVQAVSQAYTRERHAIDQGATGEAAYRARRHFYLPRDGAKVVKPLVELHGAGALPAWAPLARAGPRCGPRQHVARGGGDARAALRRERARAGGGRRGA
ncbi:MAG: hypothetical protein IPL19_25170 [Sandaracinaceae bacterium]|nr:hypothetical protein [Sandaracinaceae bacterium]